MMYGLRSLGLDKVRKCNSCQYHQVKVWDRFCYRSYWWCLECGEKDSYDESYSEDSYAEDKAD